MSCSKKSKTLVKQIDGHRYEHKVHKCKLGGYCIGEDDCQYHKKFERNSTDW